MVKSNCIKADSHSYLVKNQNAFNKALYDFFGINDESNTTKKEIRNMVQTYPAYYPCMIIIINQSFECSRIYIDCLKLDELSAEIDKFI